jgi:NADP oxidoreductase coenzyme F420-dependent
MFRSIIQLSSHGNRRGPIHRALGTSTSTSTSTSTLPPDRFFATAESPDRILRNASTSTGTSTESAKNVARFEKVAFLGTGKIAQAIISPLIKTGLQPAERVAIFDVSVPAMKAVQANHPGIQLAQSIPELVDGADLLVCAVKPQNITEGLCTELKKANIPINATFLSVIAGLPLQTYYATGYKKIVRSMPNTPAMIG